MQTFSRSIRRATGLVAAACLLSVPVAALAAGAPTVKLALSFRPVQKDVEYETPKQSEYDKCKVEVERKGKASGWVVTGPNGQIVRRFVDTNGDNVVDQWRYYRHGLEVYRDIDTDFNNKVDQSRWLNTAGTRWGVDKNEDGRIDEWKIISAEEASREAVQALAAGDAEALQLLFITKAELESLGISSELQKKILDDLDSPAKKLRDLLSKGGVTSKTVWVRFSASSPGIVPGDDGKAKRDLAVYQNAMAIVETGGKSGLVQIGEMVLVGNTWRLTQMPLPIGENARIASAGHLMQPALPTGTTAAAAGGISKEMQKLLADLQELDRGAPKPTDGAAAFVKYNARRAAIIRKIIAAAPTETDRTQWWKQLIDGVAAGVQSGTNPDGLKDLQRMEAQIRRENSKSELLPYVSFRRLLGEYTVKLQTSAASKRADVQKWWLKELEDFATTFPKSEDSSEAMLQLAIALEFTGQTGDARKWYGRSVAGGEKTPAGIRAAGALRRLDLEGKTLSLSGPSLGATGGPAASATRTLDVADYRGKVVLVVFWSTWCKPCTEDLPQLQALYRKHKGDGFEIVGVNLDADAGPAKPFLAKHRVPWPHIHRDGGLDSPPARKYGIISLPTMFLVDRRGKVLSRSTSVEVLQKTLAGVLKGK